MTNQNKFNREAKAFLFNIGNMEIQDLQTIKEIEMYANLDTSRKIKKITIPFKGIILIDNTEQIEYFFESVDSNKYEFSFEQEFDEFHL